MTRKPARQQILLALLAFFGVIRVGDWVLSSIIEGPLRELQGSNEQVQTEIQKYEKALAAARTAGKRIDQWKTLSLPSDTETSRTLYRTWLVDLVAQSRLQNPTVDSGSPASRYGLYRTLPFNLRARASLDQISRFLFTFTQAGHLHRISSLNLSPAGSDGQFEVAMGIETVLLPGVQRRQLARRKSEILASTSLSEYAAISRRNIFGSASGYVDPQEDTIVSAITYSNGRPKVWITQRSEDRVSKLQLNESVDVGDFHGQISQITDQQVVIKTDSGSWKLRIGQSFADVTGVQ